MFVKEPKILLYKFLLRFVVCFVFICFWGFFCCCFYCTQCPNQRRRSEILVIAGQKQAGWEFGNRETDWNA